MRPAVGNSPGGVQENRQLTGLRGIAALDVMVSHLNSSDLWFLRGLQFHNAAVDLFFCLSAFTLCLVYGAGEGRRLDLRKFAAARIARIYPLYLASLVLAAGTVAWESSNFAAYPKSVLISDLLKQVMLVDAWPLIGNGVHWDLPAWSVSVEAFCYLFLFAPLFALSAWALRLPLATRTSLLLVLSFSAFVACEKAFNAGISSWNHAVMAAAWPYWAACARGAAMFTAGWLAHLSYLKRDALSEFAISACDSTMVLFVLVLAGQYFSLIDRQAVVMIFPFMILGLTEQRSVAARLLACQPFHFFGVISYSIYLLHFPILDITKLAAPGLMTNAFARVSLCSIITLASATLSYYLIEAPGRRLLRAWLRVPSRSERP